MALTKSKKHEVVTEVSELLGNSKLTVVAKYQGTTVKAIQALRREAKASGTKVSVVKNRLLIKALESNDKLKDIDKSALTGQLLYAFNSEDEVAPAQSLANFAKTNPTIEFVGAITSEGEFMSAQSVTVLASLPSKPQLIAGIINTLKSPVNGVISGLKGNLHGLLQSIEASKA
ncbi:50S ribosomal protein L10 [Candidatus Saccharibacteria bacterium]|nr:50S ribosomal protein L10 [Candidatus Saccharibacteria bacterium]